MVEYTGENARPLSFSGAAAQLRGASPTAADSSGSSTGSSGSPPCMSFPQSRRRLREYHLTTPKRAAEELPPQALAQAHNCKLIGHPLAQAQAHNFKPIGHPLAQAQTHNRRLIGPPLVQPFQACPPVPPSRLQTLPAPSGIQLQLVPHAVGLVCSLRTTLLQLHPLHRAVEVISSLRITLFQLPHRVVGNMNNLRITVPQMILMMMSF